MSDDGDGCHYIMPGTWLRDRRHYGRELGVVVDTLEVHPSGTVKIRWYASSTEYVSATVFRNRLMNGEMAVDDGGELREILQAAGGVE